MRKRMKWGVERMKRMKSGEREESGDLQRQRRATRAPALPARRRRRPIATGGSRAENSGTVTGDVQARAIRDVVHARERQEGGEARR